MDDITTALEAEGYAAVKLARSKLGQLEVAAEINGNSARLVIDTGASKTVLDSTSAAALGVEPTRQGEDSAMGCGLGETGVAAQPARLASLQLEQVDLGELDVSLVDMSHVNAGLAKAGAARIDGVLGADVLIEREAIIRYASQTLHLRV